MFIPRVGKGRGKFSECSFSKNLLFVLLYINDLPSCPYFIESAVNLNLESLLNVSMADKLSLKAAKTISTN
jgi:hypothetical protein